jgi:glycosyltransferase involved in cell wall biosynthesis
LYVGSLFNRRHIPDLIEAFGLLQRNHPDVEIDIVGDNRTYPVQDIEALIARARANGRARWRRYVTDDALAGLYGSAGAFAFLSDYEGFGLTPLEAMSRGVPPVLFDTAVARETCGDAALYVAPGHVPDIADALERLLFDAPTRREVLAAAPAVLARYRWPEAARATLRVLETVAR